MLKDTAEKRPERRDTLLDCNFVKLQLRHKYTSEEYLYIDEWVRSFTVNNCKLRYGAKEKHIKWFRAEVRKANWAIDTCQGDGKRCPIHRENS